MHRRSITVQKSYALSGSQKLLAQTAHHQNFLHTLHWPASTPSILAFNLWLLFPGPSSSLDALLNISNQILMLPPKPNNSNGSSAVFDLKTIWNLSKPTTNNGLWFWTFETILWMSPKIMKFFLCVLAAWWHCLAWSLWDDQLCH